MYTLISILIHSAGMTFDDAGALFTSLNNGTPLAANGSEILLASALITATKSSITERIRSGMRKWHGNMNSRFSGIENESIELLSL
jgi:hypothetical protein